MPSEYENETCAGCIHAVPDNEYVFCHKEECTGQCRYSTKACEHFIPSLECRKVRALEKLSSCVGVYGDEKQYPGAYFNTYAEPED